VTVPFFICVRALRLMAIGTKQSGRKNDSIPQYNVRRVQTSDEMLLFTEIQALSFLGQDQPEFEWWREFMRRKGRENLRNRSQRFLLAYDGAHPVGTLICVYSDALVGLYAIATVPEHRRRGVCSTLVDVALIDASTRGLKMTTLQVMRGSTAQLVYQNLGFREIFHAHTYEAG
jgi:ribosomal protein S18 acetylase RimI-like enzyme